MNDELGPREQRVRDALHDTVDDLEPTGGLSQIRARLQEDAMPASRPLSRNALLALGGAAAVAVVVTGVVLVTQDTGRPDSDAPPASSSSLTPAPTPTDSPSTEPSSPSPTDTSTPAPTATTRSLPVYYVGDTPNGPRLYREFHRVEVVAGDELARAVRQAVEAPPLDPDYRTPWPSGTKVNQVTSLSSEQVITIDLSGASAGSLHDRPAGMSKAEAGMAVEQLIYTAQAAVQDRAPVQLLLDGNRTDQVLGVPTSEPLANGDEMSTLATVWITSPQDGDTLPADAVRIQGRGSFFEATVAWQLLAADGTTVVKNGSSMSQECCILSPYDFTIRGVQPGDYVIRVYDEDMSGGEGPGETEDTKRITVQ